MPGDVTLAVSGVEATPLDYPIPGAAELLLKLVSANYDGSAAAGSFVPTIQLLIASTQVVGSFPLAQTLAAGASADVSWFPRGGLGGSSSVSSAVRVPVTLDTADAAGDAFPALTVRYGFANVRRVLPAFSNAVDGSWTGSVVVPGDYSGSPKLRLLLVADASSGTVRVNVATSVVAVGSSEDPAYTAEAYVNTVVPGSANQLFEVDYSLSSSPAPGRLLNVQVNRNGSSGSDTLAVPLLVVGVVFEYASV